MIALQAVELAAERGDRAQRVVGIVGAHGAPKQVTEVAVCECHWRAFTRRGSWQLQLRARCRRVVGGNVSAMRIRRHVGRRGDPREEER